LVPAPPCTPILPAIVPAAEVTTTLLLPLPSSMPLLQPAAVPRTRTVFGAGPVTRNTPAPKVPPGAV
jgi:hypothetical protein